MCFLPLYLHLPRQDNLPYRRNHGRNIPIVVVISTVDEVETMFRASSRAVGDGEGWGGGRGGGGGNLRSKSTRYLFMAN